MVIYIDLVFALNSLADGLALYVTACLSGSSFRWIRLITSAFLGGVYGAACRLPPLTMLGNVFVRAAVAFLLVRIVFCNRELLLRYYALFFVLSCTLGGTLFAFAQFSAEYGIEKSLKQLDWKVFLLAGVMCWLCMSLIFRRGIQHEIKSQVLRGSLKLNERIVCFNALYDTGHTLSDPFTGEQVMTVWCKAIWELFDEDEKQILSFLESDGGVGCAQRLSAIAPGRYRLIPYRCVGVKMGMLLAFRTDIATLDDRELGPITIALSPTPVSDGGGYAALWGGDFSCERSSHGKN